MGGFEVIVQAAAENAEAWWAEVDAWLDGPPPREGLPLELWRAARFTLGVRSTMPTAPPRVCARCHRPAPKGGRCACRPAWEGSARRAARGRRWQQLRAAKLRANPVCEHPGCRRVS